MSKTILESLAGKKPCSSRIYVKNASLSVIYDLVRTHMAEIEEAIARGYSWKQIDEACRESWQIANNKAAGIVWWRSGDMIQSCYKAVKHGTTAGKKAARTASVALDMRITPR